MDAGGLGVGSAAATLSMGPAGGASAFGGAYRGKTVLITGHTGFKGSWLATWLLDLGARVVGYSAYLPSSPCHFDACGLASRVADVRGDVRDLDRLRAVFVEYRPEIVFHLAAQPLVRRSLDDPKLTFDTNVGGTVNVLECLRESDAVTAAVIVTSDKCYENMGWPWGYRETDRLGGQSPYSASKACAEIICSAYARSLLADTRRRARLATARAGNVIGGGDWAQDRIVPDCVRAWSAGQIARIRSPHATRPWQHVLEPLSGYLWLGAALVASPRLHGEAFNFGPSASAPVSELIETFCRHWEGAAWDIAPVPANAGEDVLLQLACDKALHMLEWRTVLTLDEIARLTVEWYRSFYARPREALEVSRDQIARYTAGAAGQHLPWANAGHAA